MTTLPNLGGVCDVFQQIVIPRCGQIPKSREDQWSHMYAVVDRSNLEKTVFEMIPRNRFPLVNFLDELLLILEMTHSSRTINCKRIFTSTRSKFSRKMPSILHLQRMCSTKFVRTLSHSCTMFYLCTRVGGCRTMYVTEYQFST